MSKLFVAGIVLLTAVIIGGILLSNRAQPGDIGEEASPSSSFLGQKAPDFELEDFEGQKVSLASLKGKKAVLFFSEGLMCYPACWDQMAKLSQDSRLNNENVVSYSIIVDQKSQWQQAFEKMPELRKTKVLFDVYATASRNFNVLNLASSMHKGRYPGHTYFILDRQGVIRFFDDDPQMGIRNDHLVAELDKIS